jgi:osmotically inducible lipoprotein OsmB
VPFGLVTILGYRDACHKGIYPFCANCLQVAKSGVDTIMKRNVVALLALGVLASACSLNQAERRAVTGGAIGAGAGAAGGYMLGYDPITSAAVGAAGGAVLGAVTTPDKEKVVHHYYHPGKKKKHDRHDD